ncbi:hypothetical protein Efla_004769 [Eimeria flavescens]
MKQHKTSPALLAGKVALVAAAWGSADATRSAKPRFVSLVNSSRRLQRENSRIPLLLSDEAAEVDWIPSSRPLEAGEAAIESSWLLPFPLSLLEEHPPRPFYSYSGLHTASAGDHHQPDSPQQEAGHSDSAEQSHSVPADVHPHPDSHSVAERKQQEEKESPSRTLPRRGARGAVFHGELEILEEEGGGRGSPPHGEHQEKSKEGKKKGKDKEEKKKGEDKGEGLGMFARFKRLLTGKNVNESMERERAIADFADTERGRLSLPQRLPLLSVDPFEQ